MKIYCNRCGEVTNHSPLDSSNDPTYNIFHKIFNLIRLPLHWWYSCNQCGEVHTKGNPSIDELRREYN